MMTAARIKNWFERKQIGRIWYLILFSLGFGLILAVVSRLSMYFLDALVFGDPTRIGPFSFAISVLFACGVGYYIARTTWPKS